MEWKLTTLIENHEDTEEKYVCEHGFSILIEKMDSKPPIRLLMDTGQSGAFFDNAEKMQEYFEELEGDYYKLADRTRQHIVELKATQENKKLIRHLEEINYITSWECKHKNIYNKETEQDEQIEMIRCRVKKKK